MRHFERVREVRLAGKAELRLVLLGGEVVRAAEEIDVVAGPILAHFVDELDEPQIDGAPRADTHRGFSYRVHSVHFHYSSLSRRADHFGCAGDMSFQCRLECTPIVYFQRVADVSNRRSVD